jgi:hypothetical protein
VTTAVNAAGANFGTIDKSEWYVISDKIATSTNCDRWDWHCTDYSSKQEFIARCQLTANVGGTQVLPANNCDGFVPPNAESPTPDPATMSLLALGLAGMAGMNLRRRRKLE